ncbi:hypothetical protein [Bacillus sp. UNC438CL73TsuS30]|uniref:hypothetical protein n=1 Tax=Bacillus sp. UNC438CL73TsuS30 TaxID=1340434 RepID=UPI00047C2A3B|nr:hypothetical protein [Bacillus sp. UNC438CL73TsuS30]
MFYNIDYFQKGDEFCKENLAFSENVYGPTSRSVNEKQRITSHHIFGNLKIMETAVGETAQNSLMINLDLDGYPYLE